MCVCVLFVAVFMIVLFVCNRVCVLLISTVSISNLIKSVYTNGFLICTINPYAQHSRLYKEYNKSKISWWCHTILNCHSRLSRSSSWQWSSSMSSWWWWRLASLTMTSLRLMILWYGIILTYLISFTVRHWTIHTQDYITLHNVWQNNADIIFLSIFIAELGLKVIAMGFVLDPDSYLRNPWNVIDFIVVTTG